MATTTSKNFACQRSSIFDSERSMV